jgi:eukaryotic-like serine/threonine-protein kinase
VKFCPHCSAFFPNDATFCPDDGTELKRTQDPYLGRTIADRYQLVKRLGQGGMSNVYLAHHVMIERLSALKILREDLSRQEAHRARFLREARAVNRINHPNIVEISDLGEADGVAYLVMEYVDGPSLHEEIEKGIFTWQRAVRIGLQVAAALARAHEMGVVHRDLKPENLLLTKPREDPVRLPRHGPATERERDFVKLTDFGIAKILDEPNVTMGDQLFGTPGYVAPEYLEGATTDPRSDLYSLGVILYEMTTGTLPYDARGGALMSAPLREPPIPPSQRRPDFFQPLEDLILHLLARDPGRRPPDAFAVYDALVFVQRAETAGQDGPPVVVSTPAATRISYASQLGVRQDAKTMMEIVTPETSAPLVLKESSEALALTASKTGRWYEALGQLESAIVVMSKRNVEAVRIERAVDLLAVSREKLATLERIQKALGEQQERVDALEAEGRTFRAEFGRAIDQLVRDRSRERAQRLEGRRRVTPVKRKGGDDADSDAELWETAALAATETGSVDKRDDDLTFQINALQRNLHSRNLAHEKEVAEATGALEGSLAAVRHVTGELERLLEEALGMVLSVYAVAGGIPAAAEAPRIWRR